MFKLYFEPCIMYICKPEEIPTGVEEISYEENKPAFAWNIFSSWAMDITQKNIAISGPDPGKYFRELCKHFLLIDAAGGIVENPAGEILLIHRLGKWDLPKGKIDTGEHAAEAAKREVTEETRIDQLHITGSLPETFHAYQSEKNKWMLKKTYWFAMKTTSMDKPTPQVAEQILQAVWADKKEVKNVLKQCYMSIEDLLQGYLYNIHKSDQ